MLYHYYILMIRIYYTIKITVRTLNLNIKYLYISSKVDIPILRPMNYCSTITLQKKYSGFYVRVPTR